MTIEDDIEWDNDNDDALAITVMTALTTSCIVMKEHMDKRKQRQKKKKGQGRPFTISTIYFHCLGWDTLNFSDAFGQLFRQINETPDMRINFPMEHFKQQQIVHGFMKKALLSLIVVLVASTVCWYGLRNQLNTIVQS